MFIGHVCSLCSGEERASNQPCIGELQQWWGAAGEYNHDDDKKWERRTYRKGDTACQLAGGCGEHGTTACDGDGRPCGLCGAGVECKDDDGEKEEGRPERWGKGLR